MSNTNQLLVDWPNLLNHAILAREFAYAPYSHYKVGAAVLTQSGKIYTGCNIENAGYSGTVCAERTAIFKAVSEGERAFVAIAVVTANAGSPCGVCRQIMREFSVDLPILVGDINYNYQIFTLADLLPHSFGPESLS